ncbi:MAG: hypothetical protein ACQEP8_02645 [Chlamydiota bacterium]
MATIKISTTMKFMFWAHIFLLAPPLLSDYKPEVEAHAYYETGQYNKALDKFYQLQEERLSPLQNAIVLNDIGCVFLAQKKWALAIKAFSRALSFPDLPYHIIYEIHNNLAISYLKQCQNSEKSPPQLSATIKLLEKARRQWIGTVKEYYPHRSIKLDEIYKLIKLELLKLYDLRYNYQLNNSTFAENLTETINHLAEIQYKLETFSSAGKAYQKQYLQGMHIKEEAYQHLWEELLLKAPNNHRAPFEAAYKQYLQSLNLFEPQELWEAYRSLEKAKATLLTVASPNPIESLLLERLKLLPLKDKAPAADKYLRDVIISLTKTELSSSLTSSASAKLLKKFIHNLTEIPNQQPLSIDLLYYRNIPTPEEELLANAENFSSRKALITILEDKFQARLEEAESYDIRNRAIEAQESIKKASKNLNDTSYFFKSLDKALLAWSPSSFIRRQISSLQKSFSSLSREELLSQLSLLSQQIQKSSLKSSLREEIVKYLEEATQSARHSLTAPPEQKSLYSLDISHLLEHSQTTLKASQQQDYLIRALKQQKRALTFNRELQDIESQEAPLVTILKRKQRYVIDDIPKTQSLEPHIQAGRQAASQAYEVLINIPLNLRLAGHHQQQAIDYWEQSQKDPDHNSKDKKDSSSLNNAQETLKLLEQMEKEDALPSSPSKSINEGRYLW